MVLIDDEEWLIEMMELAIGSEFKNIELRTFQDSKKAWQELARKDPDILITGANMGELSGEEIVRRLIEQKAAYPILVMSGWAPAEKWVKSFANKKPNISFLRKPFKTEELSAAISKLLARNDKPTFNIMGLCPKCGLEVLEGSTGFFCRGKECGFRIAGVLLGQVLNSLQASKLLREGRTDLLSGFVSKSGRIFSAWLVLDNEKVVFDFPKQNSQEIAEAQKPAANNGHNGDECSPLLEAATRDLFRKNAFRITGLSVDTTVREANRHADKLKMLAELGQGSIAECPAFSLKPPPSLDEIREALQKLKDPERRMVDEFFWFWPEEFGQSQTDAALQALKKGDSETALEIWNAKENSAKDGVVACHNLALVFQIRALDWENHSFENEVSQERQQKIADYWTKSLDRWPGLATNEILWEKVMSRIRQLNEPNLTVDFAARMRSTMPKAMGKINAELALAFAESGKIELAHLHIRIMRKIIKDPATVEETAELVLTPCKNQLKEQIQQAKESAQQHPASAHESARALIHSARPALFLFNLFFEDQNHAQKDIFDEVVTTTVNCLVAYQRKTDDNKTFVELLDLALPLAQSNEARKRTEENIKIGKANLNLTRLEPFHAKLKSIQDDKATPKSKLERIRVEILPRHADLVRTEGSSSEIVNQFSDAIAWALRAISIDAHNEQGDTETAMGAIELAYSLAREEDLKKGLENDKQQMGQIKSENDKHNLLLQIRNDQIEVSNKIVRYNSTCLPTDDITGVRFGVFTHYTNGAKTSVSYLVGLLSAMHGSIEIECKRFFRGEDKAKADFDAILSSLFYHVIPGLCTRIAQSIANGHECSLGDANLTSQGIRATVGKLLWKEEMFVPWSDVRFGFAQGHLNISSAKNRKFTKSYALRQVWNAAIFEETTKILMKLRRNTQATPPPIS